LEDATNNLKQFRTSAERSCKEVQTDDEFNYTRPTSRLGAISPAVHIFDGPASHRIIPGSFKGCNYAAGMSQESLVRPSSIKNNNRIKIPASGEKVHMSFVTEHGQSTTPKTVFKISKDKETGAPFITSSSHESLAKNESKSGSSTSIASEVGKANEQPSATPQRQKSEGTSDVVEKIKKPYTKVERVRKKRSMFEKASTTDPAPTSLSRKTAAKSKQTVKPETETKQVLPQENMEPKVQATAKKSQIKSVSKSFPSVVPRTSKEKSKSQTEEVKAEQIEKILETCESSTSVSSNERGLFGHKMTSKSNVQKASSGLKISKVKAPKKESTAEVITEEMAPPPGELRRRFSEDSISSEASISSDSSSKSSLVRQRAAQWKEKETGNPNAKLPIPVQTGRRDKSRSRDSHR